MTAYFAYGSNLAARQMQCRCPEHVEIGIGLLRRYKWIITSRGYASVIPSENDEVWGFVYDISSDDEAQLDRYEGSSYEKHFLDVDVNGSREKALVYIDKVMTAGRPKDEYIRRMRQGLSDRELPKNYISKYMSQFLDS